MGAPRIKLGDAPAFEVPLPDPATDADRIYRPRVASKSVAEKWSATKSKLADYERRFDDSDKPPTAAEVAKHTRLLCDCLNVLLVPAAEGAVDAGDHLYSLWEADTPGVDRGAVAQLVRDVIEQTDPT